MTNKRYSEMDNAELTAEAKRIAYSRKKAGETHFNLLYALAFRIEELVEPETPSAPTTPARCRTVEDVVNQRGLSLEAARYLRDRHREVWGTDLSEAFRAGGLV